MMSKTGGILIPTPSIPYKLGGTPSFDITLDIPKGPGIVSVEVYKKYTGQTEILDQTVTVGSANATEDATLQLPMIMHSYLQVLICRLMRLVLAIGDAWTLRYVSVMEDGRKVDVSKKSTITVANKYAGYYECDGSIYSPDSRTSSYQ